MTSDASINLLIENLLSSVNLFWYSSTEPQYFYSYIPNTNLEIRIPVQNQAGFTLNLIDSKKSKTQNTDFTELSLNVGGDHSPKLFSKVYEKVNETRNQFQSMPEEVKLLINALKTDPNLDLDSSDFTKTSDSQNLFKHKKTNNVIKLDINYDLNNKQPKSNEPLLFQFFYKENLKNKSYEHFIPFSEIKDFKSIYNSSLYKKLKPTPIISNITDILSHTSTMENDDNKTFLNNQILKAIINPKSKATHRKPKSKI